MKCKINTNNHIVCTHGVTDSQTRGSRRTSRVANPDTATFQEQTTPSFAPGLGSAPSLGLINEQVVDAYNSHQTFPERVTGRNMVQHFVNHTRYIIRSEALEHGGMVQLRVLWVCRGAEASQPMTKAGWKCKSMPFPRVRPSSDLQMMLTKTVAAPQRRQDQPKSKSKNFQAISLHLGGAQVSERKSSADHVAWFHKMASPCRHTVPFSRHTLIQK